MVRYDLARPHRAACFHQRIEGLGGRPLGAQRAVGQLVIEALGCLLASVEKQDRIGKEDAQVGALRGAGKRDLDAFELVNEVIAEGPIEAEKGILEALEGMDQAPQRAQHRGLLATLLLGEKPRRLGDVEGELARGVRGNACVRSEQCRLEYFQKSLAALVEGGSGQRSRAGAELQRRIKEPEIVARITIGILDPRGKEGAPLGVERLHDEADAGRVVQRLGPPHEVEPRG